MKRILDPALPRKRILDAARQVVCVRMQAYGTPKAHFERVARRWNAHLANVGMAGELTAVDVAMMLIDLKLARLENDPKHEDSWIDVAGYGACGGETAND